MYYSGSDISVFVLDKKIKSKPIMTIASLITNAVVEPSFSKNKSNVNFAPTILKANAYIPERKSANPMTVIMVLFMVFNLKIRNKIFHLSFLQK